LQTELHRHLDVSVRASTLLELAQERGHEARSTSLESFREKLVLRKPMADLKEVLAQFSLFQAVLDRPEVLERVAYEVIEDCRSEGTRKVELRFAPSFVCEKTGLSWEDALGGFESGVKRALAAFPEMKAGLICIAVRDYGLDEVSRAVEFYLAHRSRFVGVDLAGNEVNFPCRLFESAFKPAIASGSRITIHAGEATGPENIWEAVELLGAQRIGHGIACVKDPELMRYLSERSICLEMCPTSNWLTHAVARLEDHPLPLALRAGIPVSINTDDPAVFGVTLDEEIRNCRERMGLSESELRLCQEHASRASFIA
jgi:adenosine deaminase